MTSFGNTTRGKLGNLRGFTLTELMIVVAVIGILSAIAFPLYANVTTRARIAKAQADIRGMVSAVSAYTAHMGELPAALANLTVVATNQGGITAGPFIGAVPPTPAPTWGSYAYNSNVSGTFTISAAGDGATVSAP